jgi:hypothetical protein
MAQWLNKKVVFLLLFICGYGSHFSQMENRTNEKEYKDPQQFEKFQKRRIVVGAWQINQLKEGALVVRLKTNKMLIDELTKKGKTEEALQVRLEQFAINKNTMFAYRDNLKFCKVYFIYSNSSDSLLNGIKSGIFLDTNLVVDPTITMTEKFYLIAERDYGYNSSIGFVREDSAMSVSEQGNAVKQMAIVVKNKYGHQLKSPFPYFVKEKNFMDVPYDFPVRVDPVAGGGTQITFAIDRTFLQDQKDPQKNPSARAKTLKGSQTVKVKKHFTYEKIAMAVDELNAGLNEFYRTYPKPDVTRIDQRIIPFLY